MTKEYIVTGRTVEEAVTSAHSRYGRDGEVTYEILEMPKKGFLGLGAKEAKIRVKVTEDEKITLDALLSDVLDKKPAEKSQAQKSGQSQKNQNAQGQKQKNQPQKPAAEKKDQPQQKAGVQKQNGQKQKQNQVRSDKPQQNQPKSQQNQPKAEKPPVKTEKPQAKAEKPQKPARSETPVVITEEEMGYAVEFAETLIRSMELDAKVLRVTDEDGQSAPRINIEGDDTGILIGHHGETLDAIQYLINLSANRRSGGESREFVKIAVDVENYRAKREAALRALARRMAEKSKKYKKNIVLEPMNPYERRIIHSEIQEIEDVSTHSVGYDENRKIVITYEGADKPAESSRNNRRKRRGRGGRSGEGRSGAPVKEKAAESREEKSFADSDDYAAPDYTYERKPQAKPEKMSFEDFAAAAPEDIPMGILSKKVESDHSEE